MEMQTLELAPKEIIKRLYQIALREGVHEVKFIKLNGVERVMRCTLDPALVPERKAPLNEEEESEMKRKENPDSVPVWDLDKKAWRAFRWDSIRAFQKIADK